LIWTIVKGDRKRYNGQLEAQHGRLSGDQLTAVDGKRFLLSRKIQ
jgi:uncharacterized protein YjbJ (UPF0337 family)